MLPPVTVSEVNSNKDTLVNNDVAFVVRWIMFAGVIQLIDVFGVVTNIINIICFIKQGFKDPVNVTFLGLAVSDIGCLVTIMVTNVCCIPAVDNPDVGFDPIEFQYLTGAVPHVTFTRITSWTTAFVTLERCLCITMPLKIKSIITSRRVAFVIVSVTVIMISTTAPIYVVNKLGWKYFTQKNRTMLGLHYTEDREEVERISFGINSIFMPIAAFFIIITCTIILVIKLQQSAKWRTTSTGGNTIDRVSSRNQNVAKMVVMVSVLFIACFVPLSILFIALSFEPELSVSGKYRNTLVLLAMTVIFLESVNSSLNIFIYYRMSNKYRETFCLLFCKQVNSADTHFQGTDK